MQSIKNKFWKTSNYKEKYKCGILSLFKVNYPETNLWKENFFEWQNFKNPAGKSIIKLAINDLDEVVGFYCVMPQIYWINGKKILGSISLNTLVREDFRGMGIFTVLAKECFEECKKRKIHFTLGFPNQNSYPGFIGKLEFTDMGEMPLLIKPLRLGNLVSYKFKTEIFKLLLSPIDRLINKDNKTCKEKILEIEKFNNQTSKALKNNCVVKDKNFLNWRVKWPERNYKIFTTEINQTKGFIVLRTIETEGLKNGLIVDLMVDDKKNNLEVGKCLIRIADKYFRKMGADQIGCLISKKSDEFKMLKSCGYINCPQFLKPQPMRVVTKWHNSNVPKNFYVLNKWKLSMIDYDIG